MRGTAENFKKYMRYTARIYYENLGSLDNSSIVNATGEREIIDSENGFFSYNIIYDGTENSTITDLVSNNDYKFSDDKNNFPDSTPQNFKFKETYNLTNKDTISYGSLKFIGNPNIKSTSFSFDFNLSNITGLNLENKTDVYLGYSPMDGIKEKELNCSIAAKYNYFTIDCPVKESVYTYLNTIKMKISKIKTAGRLRFLQTYENSTFYAPSELDGNIMLDYEPDITTFGRRSSKNKGLSGGAIAAIVLATIAAIAAVGITIFFLNRKPNNPPVRPTSELQLQNSSAKIQN